MFKALFPLIFSFVALGLFQVWQTYFGRKSAFIAAFFFVAQATFYTEMLGLNRQMIAELFFVLLMLVIFSKKLKPFNRFVCFALFSFALIVSHYGIAEIFLFFIFVTFLFSTIAGRTSRNITLSMLVFFFVAMFAWYLFTSSSTVFENLLSYGNFVISQLNDFLNPASRGQTLLMGLRNRSIAICMEYDQPNICLYHRSPNCCWVCWSRYKASGSQC